MSWAVWSVQCRLAGAGWRDHWPGGTCGHMVQCHQQWPPDHNMGTRPSHHTNTTTNTTLGMGAFVAVSVNSLTILIYTTVLEISGDRMSANTEDRCMLAVG